MKAMSSYQQLLSERKNALEDSGVKALPVSGHSNACSVTPGQVNGGSSIDGHSTQSNDGHHANSSDPSGNINYHLEVTIGEIDSVTRDQVNTTRGADEQSTEPSDDRHSNSSDPSGTLNDGLASHEHSTTLNRLERGDIIPLRQPTCKWRRNECAPDPEAINRFCSDEGGEEGKSGGNEGHENNYDPDCKDDHPQCIEAKHYICEQQEELAAEKCRKTCGYCGGGGFTPAQVDRGTSIDEQSTQPKDNLHANRSHGSGITNDNLEVTPRDIHSDIDSVTLGEVDRESSIDEHSTQPSDNRSSSSDPSGIFNDRLASHEHSTTLNYSPGQVDRANSADEPSAQKNDDRRSSPSIMAI
ncbi:unnamed protein product [Anisakis simplex]|uniref:ShKT domain-containing protein n=1 Tax=Anisakis simplex TaxID=6269 RepID=A0A0M3K5D1_ANISI|nr:unnamed protein product [Anisakis simplex]